MAFTVAAILELQSASWPVYKHDKTVEFLVSAVAVSKFYTRRTGDKAIAYILPWHSNIMTDKGLNVLVHVLPNMIIQAVRKKVQLFFSREQ